MLYISRCIPQIKNPHQILFILIYCCWSTLFRVPSCSKRHTFLTCNHDMGKVIAVDDVALMDSTFQGSFPLQPITWMIWGSNSHKIIIKSSPLLKKPPYSDSRDFFASRSDLELALLISWQCRWCDPRNLPWIHASKPSRVNVWWGSALGRSWICKVGTTWQQTTWLNKKPASNRSRFTLWLLGQRPSILSRYGRAKFGTPKWEDKTNIVPGWSILTHAHTEIVKLEWMGMVLSP